MKLKLFLISQSENSNYDTYDSCVVVSESEEKAKLIRPDNRTWEDAKEMFGCEWASNPKYVQVSEIGICSNPNYVEGDIVCYSFNAG